MELLYPAVVWRVADPVGAVVYDDSSRRHNPYDSRLLPLLVLVHVPTRSVLPTPAPAGSPLSFPPPPDAVGGALPLSAVSELSLEAHRSWNSNTQRGGHTVRVCCHFLQGNCHFRGCKALHVAVPGAPCTYGDRCRAGHAGVVSGGASATGAGSRFVGGTMHTHRLHETLHVCCRFLQGKCHFPAGHCRYPHVVEVTQWPLARCSFGAQCSAGHRRRPGTDEQRAFAAWIAQGNGRGCRDAVAVRLAFDAWRGSAVDAAALPSAARDSCGDASLDLPWTPRVLGTPSTHGMSEDELARSQRHSDAMEPL